jgi:hypothetical protein
MGGANAINYLDRTNLSAAAPVLMKQFRFTSTQMGCFTFTRFGLVAESTQDR